jgi:hypothetical protein
MLIIQLNLHCVGNIPRLCDTEVIISLHLILKGGFTYAGKGHRETRIT